jgi:AcrR family transcriptional regulator
MADIAHQVGLGKPTLYHYFRSKEEILVRLYEDVLDESLHAARTTIADAASPWEAIRRLIAERVVYTCHHRQLLTVFFEEEAELPPALAESVLARRREYEDLFLAVVNAHLADTGFELHTPVRVYVNACLGAANWVYKWYNPDGALSPEQLGTDIALLMLQALPAPATWRKAATRG